jgi:hypothetical protein
MRIQVVFPWLVLEKGLIAAASLAPDLFPWHALFCRAGGGSSDVLGDGLLAGA